MLHSFDVPLTTSGLDLVAQETGTLAGADAEYAIPFPNTRASTRCESNGFQMLKDVRRDTTPDEGCYVDWAFENAHMRVRMLNMAEKEVALSKGAVPPEAKGEKMHFLTCAHVGDEGLATTFVTIIEPYAGEALIASASLVDIEPTAGADDANRPVAIKVQLSNGRTDYIMHCPDRAQTHVYDGCIKMTGNFGVASQGPEGQWQRLYLLGGTRLAAGDVEVSLPAAAYTGQIRDFDKEMDGENCIYTDIQLPGGEALRGREIVIYGRPPKPWYPPKYKAEGFPQLVTYRIEGVTPDPEHPDNSAVCVGEYVFTRGYRETALTYEGNLFHPARAAKNEGTLYWDYDSGVDYHFNSGDKFEIINSAYLELSK